MNGDLVRLDNLDDRAGTALHGPPDRRVVRLHVAPHVPSNLPLRKTSSVRPEPSQRCLNPAPERRQTLEAPPGTTPQTPIRRPDRRRGADVRDVAAGFLAQPHLSATLTRTNPQRLALRGLCSDTAAGLRADGLIVVAFAADRRLPGQGCSGAVSLLTPRRLQHRADSAGVLFAGVMSELGLFAVARAWETAFSGLGGAPGRPCLAVLAVLLAFDVTTAVMALAQANLNGCSRFSL